LDGDRRGSRQAELVGNFDYRAGSQLDRARILGMGRLIKTARSKHNQRRQQLETQSPARRSGARGFDFE
jgi:hypothetical protein